MKKRKEKKLFFKTFVTQTFDQMLRWFSILLENENLKYPEDQPKGFASLLVLDTFIEKNGCN